MKILSWNVNGIRTLPQYHPWNTLKTGPAILREIGADIICFQEMKTTRAQISRDIAVPDGYDTFISLPISKGGYSGVAVYSKSSSVPVLKAEEGISGVLHTKMKPPMTAEERVSPYPDYPKPHEMVLMADQKGNTPSDFTDLDSEGRALIVDFGRFVLINTYCPNETSDERLPYKMNFHLVMEERVKNLIKEGREVIVLGDINICATPLDYVEGNLGNNSVDWWNHPCRAWFQKWIGPDGPLVDAVRRRWPDRKSMYTCWNTRISARDSNYGARVDYILVTKGLLPWFKDGNISPLIKGSDHCPIWIELHDEIQSEDGNVLRLFEQHEYSEAPRLSTKHWSEFSSKQKILSTFFTKKDPSSGEVANDGTSPKVPTQVEVSTLVAEQPLPPLATQDSPTMHALLHNASIVSEATSSQQLTLPKANHKRKTPPDNGSKPKATKDRTAKGKKPRVGQSTIQTFFGQDSASQVPAPRTAIAKSVDDEFNSSPHLDSKVTRVTAHGTQSPSGSDSPIEDDWDLQMAIRLSQQFEEEDGQANCSEKNATGKKSWSNLFAPLDPPKCTVHSEPCKELTTTKQGPTKGKKFWICSRPLGPGYDTGRSKRLREDVDPRYRCNFFKWSADVKKEALRSTRM